MHISEGNDMPMGQGYRPCKLALDYPSIDRYYSLILWRCQKLPVWQHKEGDRMGAWWHNMDAVAAFNGWMQVIAMIGAAATTVGVMLLWTNGNRMVRYLIDRERHASKRIKAVETAAEQIRKELLATQQDHDITDQRLKLAEMDADALRKEMDKTRKRYSAAEGELKDRIKELKDINITQTTGSGRTTGQAIKPKTTKLDAQQRKMLTKLLSTGPKGELDIIAVLDDAASNEAAKEFKKIFDDQGWTTSGIVQSAFSNPPEGIVLVIHSKQTAPSYAKFLQRSLTTIGLAVQAQINNKFREWSISMIVGRVD